MLSFCLSRRFRTSDFPGGLALSFITLIFLDGFPFLGGTLDGRSLQSHCQWWPATPKNSIIVTLRVASFSDCWTFLASSAPKPRSWYAPGTPLALWFSVADLRHSLPVCRGTPYPSCTNVHSFVPMLIHKKNRHSPFEGVFR